MTVCRDDPRHYTPDRLPRGFVDDERPSSPTLLPSEGEGSSRSSATPLPLPIGRAGKVGLLELTFASGNERTRLVQHFQQTPLQIFRPLYVDPERPDLAVVQIIATGGGLLQGDRYRLDVCCEAGSSVHLTTQSATKLYRAEQTYASQIVNLVAGPDALLEYLPDPVIPYRDSRYVQRTTLTVDPTATVILGEVLLPGRVAHGECHAYAAYVSQTEAFSPDGNLLFADTISLAPSMGRLNTPGRLGQHDVLGSLFIVSRQVTARDLVSRLRVALAHHEGIVAGVSELPHGAGASVRILGPTSIDVQSAMHASWGASRQTLVGLPAFDRRKT